ncbi:MAG TPA: cell division protein ZapA [Ruminiclostridium sp.]|nr:cell division protein ZapA [Clostridiaceae bacterium]HAA26004.1 cell division protein ZapA [Ruminiclostridium sp.]
MSGKNKVQVRIAGNEYILRGNESAEYMQKVALYVDTKTAEIMKANHTLSTSMASVLTAVNIADEFFKASDSNGMLKKEIEQAKKIIRELKEENAQLTQQLQMVNEENRNLVIELTKREAELSEVRNAYNRAMGESSQKSRLHNIK